MGEVKNRRIFKWLSFFHLKMPKIRKFAAYSNLKRPYTRISKFNKKNFVRGGRPNLKLTKFEMGETNKQFDTVLHLNVTKSMNIRHNSLESARTTGNRLLEKNLAKGYHLRLRVFPFHILRENPLASGAGADRMSKGMQKAYGKSISCAARVKEGQTIMDLSISQNNLKLGRLALERASKKLPCHCKIVLISTPPVQKVQ